MFMVESIVCHDNEQVINSEECSELDTTSTAMMFSNDHVVTTMDTSSMMDKQCSIYYYFSSTFEVSIFGHYFSCVRVVTCSNAEIIYVGSTLLHGHASTVESQTL